MDQRNDTMPDLLSFPADMREHTLSRREMWRLCRVSILSGLAVLFYAAALFFCIFLAYYEGLEILWEPVYLWESLLDLWKILCCFTPLWLAVRFFRLRAGIRKMKAVDLPIWYGFDEKGVYINSSLFTTALRWERLSAWRDKGDYLLLFDDACWIIWPKNIWTPEELNTLRDCLRHRVVSGSSRRK